MWRCRGVVPTKRCRRRKCRSATGFQRRHYQQQDRQQQRVRFHFTELPGELDLDSRACTFRKAYPGHFTNCCVATASNSAARAKPCVATYCTTTTCDFSRKVQLGAKLLLLTAAQCLVGKTTLRPAAAQRPPSLLAVSIRWEFVAGSGHARTFPRNGRKIWRKAEHQRAWGTATKNLPYRFLGPGPNGYRVVRREAALSLQVWAGTGPKRSCNPLQAL